MTQQKTKITNKHLIKDTDPFPCTIVRGRYGGGFYAFHESPWEVDQRVIGSDVPHYDWKRDVETLDQIIGHGATPEEAHSDLVENIHKQKLECKHKLAIYDTMSYCELCDGRFQTEEQKKKRHDRMMGKYKPIQKQRKKR